MGVSTTLLTGEWEQPRSEGSLGRVGEPRGGAGTLGWDQGGELQGPKKALVLGRRRGQPGCMPHVAMHPASCGEAAPPPAHSWGDRPGTAGQWAQQ